MKGTVAGVIRNETSQVFSEETGGGNQATAFITVNPPPKSAVTIMVPAVGRDGTFSYTSTLPGGASFALTTSGGSASQQFQNLGAGTFTVTQANPPFGFTLTSLQCNGAAQPGPTATITLTGSNSVTCVFTDTFDTKQIQTATQAAIRNFMSHRANAITSSEPDGTSGDGRLTGWLFGGGAPNSGGAPAGGSNLMGALDASSVSGKQVAAPRDMDAGAGDASGSRTALYSPFRLSGNAEDGSGSVLFSTSLSRMRQAAAETQAAKEMDGNPNQMGLGGPRAGRALVPSNPPTWDMWLEAHTNFFTDDRANAKQSGNTSLMYVGVDYRLHPAILVGVLAQFDWASESSSSLGTSADGVGWMMGPYLAMRLTQNISFDARAAWGASTDHVNPFGLFEDSFSTSRSLVSGRLAGNWFFGPVRFTPSASLVYFHETQRDYLDAIDVFIPKQTFALGRLTFGPEVGYRFRYDGGTFEPFVGLKGVWDFDKDDAAVIGPFVVGNDAWHGKVEMGVIVQTPSGVSVRGIAAYDGIGEKDFNNYQGRLLVTVPFK